LSTIANWLGHVSVNTTNKYLTPDLETKHAALAKAKPVLARGHHCGGWKTDQSLIKWLESLRSNSLVNNVELKTLVVPMGTVKWRSTPHYWALNINPKSTAQAEGIF
jgi:hypothetical protein